MPKTPKELAAVVDHVQRTLVRRDLIYSLSRILTDPDEHCLSSRDYPPLSVVMDSGKTDYVHRNHLA
jgi:hypothetical protein